MDSNLKQPKKIKNESAICFSVLLNFYNNFISIISYRNCWVYGFVCVCVYVCAYNKKKLFDYCLVLKNV